MTDAFQWQDYASKVNVFEEAKTRVRLSRCTVLPKSNCAM